MLRKPLFMLLAIFAMAQACEKADSMTDVSETPVFYANGNAGEDTISLIAGSKDPNVYLFTDYAYDDGEERLIFSGTFSSLNCTTDSCNLFLRFELRNAVQGNGSVPDSVFMKGTRVFYHKDSTIAVPATFYALSNQSNLHFSWDFGDQSIDTGFISSHFYAEPALPKTVILRTTDIQKSWKSVYTRTIFPLNTDGCPVAAIGAVRDSNVVNLNVSAFGTSSVEYNWSNGDTTASIQVPYDTLSYTVSITNQSTGCQWIVQTPGLKRVGTGFFLTPYYQYIPQINSTIYQPSTVTISWTDNQNTLWRTDLGDQNGAYFEIIRSEPYRTNEKGQKTRLLEVRFSCFLYDGAGNEMPLNGTAILAMAYP